jgi:hypothetical protein
MVYELECTRAPEVILAGNRATRLGAVADNPYIQRPERPHELDQPVAICVGQRFHMLRVLLALFLLPVPLFVLWRLLRLFKYRRDAGRGCGAWVWRGGGAKAASAPVVALISP